MTVTCYISASALGLHWALLRHVFNAMDSLCFHAIDLPWVRVIHVFHLFAALLDPGGLLGLPLPVLPSSNRSLADYAIITHPRM
jgi:hypothetical protein